MSNENPLNVLTSLSLNSIRPFNCSMVYVKNKCYQTSFRELLKIIAQILIPLMIGVFTIVIALQQHSLNKANRRQDLDIAHQLRQQQYQLDEQRRAQELALDEARRRQDLSLADNQQRDYVFSIYIRDLTNLLLMNHYRLNRTILDSIVRPMTLTLLRQLDRSRKVLLIKFLYELKMLRADDEDNRVDLTDGDLKGIELGRIPMRYLSLPGTLMTNASFISTDLTMADFEGADFSDASFINVDFNEANFYRTRLVRVQFSDSDLGLADLALADLTQSTITTNQLQRSNSYNMAKMPNGSEGINTSLIYFRDKCVLYPWNISPKDSINLTEQCHFIVLKENTTMRYPIALFFDTRLIQRQHALFQFRFQAKIKHPDKIHVEFVYFDEEQDEEIYRELGVIVSTTAGRLQTFLQYEISAGYPSNAFYLYLHMLLFNKEDIYTDFDFYIQHFDYKQYRHH